MNPLLLQRVLPKTEVPGLTSNPMENSQLRRIGLMLVSSQTSNKESARFAELTGLLPQWDHWKPSTTNTSRAKTGPSLTSKLLTALEDANTTFLHQPSLTSEMLEEL